MSNIKKLMMSAAGGGGVDVDDVFSTYLYKGNGTSQTITNGLDLAGEGGLIWNKYRSGSGHLWYDTERGIDYILGSHSTEAQYDYGGDITSVNSDGFSLGYYSGGVNYSNRYYSTWSFRKAPKFFDIQTWTGNGVNGRSISHSLNSKVGMIVVKCTSTSGTNWSTWHRGASGTLWLNATNPDSASGGGQATSGFVYNPGSNTTSFSVDNGANVNQSGRTYVAYLWAHNDGDGEFGPDSDQDIIKCGSYTNNNTAPVHIDLGWEPQWVLLRNITDASPWTLQDSMRGLVAYESDNYTKKLEANSTAAETDIRAIQPTSTGFYVPNSIDGAYNSGNAVGTRTHIYVAIRRGSLFPPESASEVFAAAFQNAVGTEPGWNSGFPVDMVIDSNVGGGSTDNRTISSRLTQRRYLALDQTQQEYAWDTGYAMDYMDGWRLSANNGPSDMSWMWKRAPGFFDVVAYNNTGNYAAQPHSLGVVPELVIMKRRSGSVGMAWYVTGFQSGKYLEFNSDAAAGNVGTVYTTHTATHFKPFNESDCIAYLFASLPGISKVGSYTGNGTSQTINCGFSAGARFILIKRTDSASDWYVWDTTRGINAGTEVALAFNSTLGYTNDTVDPASSGFIINQTSASDMNISSATYIFYAIA